MSSRSVVRALSTWLPGGLSPRQPERGATNRSEGLKTRAGSSDGLDDASQSTRAIEAAERVSAAAQRGPESPSRAQPRGSTDRIEGS